MTEQELNTYIQGTMMRLLNGGAEASEVVKTLCFLYKANGVDPDYSAIQEAVSICEFESNKAKKSGKRNLSIEFAQWFDSVTIVIKSNDDVIISLLSCYYDLGIKTPEEKNAIRVYFNRLVKRGLIEPRGGRSGEYIVLNNHCTNIDYENADTTPFRIRWPLGIGELVDLFPKSIIIVAGESNSGKTALCMNVGKMNGEDALCVEKYGRPRYINTEMDGAELKVRLLKFGKPIEYWRMIEFKESHRGFERDVLPNGINIIDYLTVHKDFYEIAGYFEKIRNALDKGIAIICIQKPPGRDVGLGGDRTKDLARLYLAIEPNKLKIVKAKIWRNEMINPNGLYCTFRLGGGCHFKKDSEWLKE